MHQLKVVLLLSSSFIPAAVAQQGSKEPYATPHRADLSLGYNFTRANAPPGACVCFQMSGGIASGSFHLTHGLSAAAEFSGGHASHISTLGQELTLTTYTFGPRYTFSHKRLSPFGQALLGAAHASDSYFPIGTIYSTTATSFALDLGGGLDLEVNRRFAIRAPEVQYLRTGFPNGSTNEQNHVTIGAGIVVKLALHPAAASLAFPPPPPQARNDLAFWCSTNVMNVEPGQRLEILGNTMTEPNHLAVAYSWTVTGGKLDGAGREVSLDTTNMAPGRYQIVGHAVATDIPGLTASCDLAFRVMPSPEAAGIVVAATAPPAPHMVSEKVFHENVKDALFDYDRWDLRPDTKQAIDHAAEYLKTHPDLNVLVGGYSDERGTEQYNLALGVKRARATRDALVADGVESGRVQIVSYGKGQQVCTEKDEVCFQQNRRAAFMLHP